MGSQKHQLRQWVTATRPMIDILDPCEYGWEKENCVYVASTTDESFAPESLITLVSCQCKGACQSKSCSCKSSKEVCTDMCGCTELCENTDPVISEIELDEEELDEED